MLGILLKDFVTTKKQIIWYVFMIALFCVVAVVTDNVAFAGSIGMVVAISVPTSAIAYEERDGFNKIAVASGIDKKVIVIEKYLLGFLFLLIGGISYFLVYYFSKEQANKWIEFVVSMCMQIVLLAIVMPVIFKFGVEKGRAYMILFMVVFLSIFIALMSLINFTVDSAIVVLPIVITITIIGLVASIFLSIQIYGKKDF